MSSALGWSQNVAQVLDRPGAQQGSQWARPVVAVKADGTRIRSGASIARYSSGKRSRNTPTNHLQPQRAVGQLERARRAARPDRARFVVGLAVALKREQVILS